MAVRSCSYSCATRERGSSGSRNSSMAPVHPASRHLVQQNAPELGPVEQAMVEPSLAVTAGAHDRDQPRAERRRREKARKYGGLVSPSPIVPKGVAARASEGASARGKPDAQRRPTRSLSISVLGPLWVSAGCRPVSVTTTRLRALLVAVALSADDEVSVGRLAGIIWDTTPPVHVRRATQVYVTRLRKLLGADAIVTPPAGFTVHVHPEAVDASLFERLVDAAAVGDPAAERAGLERALAL